MAVTRLAMPRPPVLDRPQLAAWVADALGCDPADVSIVGRQENVYTSTWPTEIVDCRIEGSRRRLLVKHGRSGVRNAHGHAVGPTYESAVYESVLAPLGLAHPYLGRRHDPASGWSSVVLEYLCEGWWRLNRAEPAAIVRVAAWLGAFHARPAAPAGALRGTLNEHDAEFYAGWADRSRRYVAHLGDAYSWLGGVCRSFGTVAAQLLAEPRTVVHGEFYPQNILVNGQHIRPVDWEWAAIAAGEVDLAALTEGWSADLADTSHRAYAGARWPGGAPADHTRRLDAARVYLHLRWLADRTDRLHAPELQSRLADLELVARRLRLV